MESDILEALEMGSSERISVVMPKDLKDKFERLCKLENRSMSNMLVTLAQQAVTEAEQQGKLPKDTTN